MKTDEILSRIGVVLTVALFSGCSGANVSSLLGSVGSEERTILQPDGKTVKEFVKSDKNLSDTGTFYDAAAKIANSVTAATTSKVNGVQVLSTSLINSTSSQEAKGAYGAIAIMAVSNIKEDYGQAIAALGKRPMSKVEGVVSVGSDLLHLGVGIATAKYTSDTLIAAIDNAGSKYISNNTGDGNNVSMTSKETSTTSTIHNNAFGDNSNPQTTLNQDAAGCPDGDCGDPSEPPPEDWECVTDEDCVGTDNGEQCVDHTCTDTKKYCSGERGTVEVIYTDDSGIDWVSPTCSCDSYQAGHCDV